MKLGIKLSLPIFYPYVLTLVPEPFLSMHEVHQEYGGVLHSDRS